MFQQPLLSPKPACIARQRPVGADNAVAGHHNPEWIPAIGGRHRPNGFLVADAPGQGHIRHGYTKRHIEQRSPNGLLEGRSHWIYGKIEGLTRTGKVFLKLPDRHSDRLGQRVGPEVQKLLAGRAVRTGDDRYA